MIETEEIRTRMAQIVKELAEARAIGAGSLIVIGCSTSEVAGNRIGTAGTMEVANALYAGIEEVRRVYGFDVAYQCCEHLNRALVVERRVQRSRGLEEVAAVPVRRAGGSMAAYAYRQLNEPCLVETIQADGGVDIGDTLIGMHLRRVAVPFRPSIRTIGAAHVTAAFTRPKLIGGERAVYRLDREADHAETGDEG